MLKIIVYCVSMNENKNNLKGFYEGRLTPNSLQLGDDDTGWLSIFGKVAPILGGIGAIGSFINSVIAAQQTAAFQEKLIDALQAIEQTLEGIKNDLDAIYQELKNIEQDIEGLGLNDKMTAIDTWSMEMAALDPTDTHGAQKLATAMLKASQGETNLLGCMIGIHNAMVGEYIGTPLITLMDAPSFIRLRARLVRGLHLLAFATAFNTEEKYEYGVFLLQWAKNFSQQTELYFAANKDVMLFTTNHSDNDPADVSSCDCIALYKYAQPQLSNVSVVMIRPEFDPLPFYSGSLFCVIRNTGESFLSVHPDWDYNNVFFDLDNSEFTFDDKSQLAQDCINAQGSSRFWILGTAPFSTSYVDQMRPCTLMCTARLDYTQTFLGAVAGQMHWLEATGERSSLVSSIYDGTTTDSAIVTYDEDAKAASVKAFDALGSMSEALWTTAWDAGAVTIVLSANTGDPIYLGIDAAGNWQVSAEQQAFGVVEFPAPIPGPMINPLDMPPTPVTLKSSMGGQKSVLFRQF